MTYLENTGVVFDPRVEIDPGGNGNVLVIETRCVENSKEIGIVEPILGWYSWRRSLVRVRRRTSKGQWGVSSGF